MKAYHNSVVLRNDGIDPSSLKADLNAGITVPVTVRINATQALAAIFDLDEVGTSNPLTTSNNGNYAFKAADNVYDIIISEGTANEVVLEKVEIFDIPASLNLIADLSQAYEFKTKNEMESSSIIFPVGKSLHVAGEINQFINYEVLEAGSVPSGDLELDDGKWAVLLRYASATVNTTTGNVQADLDAIDSELEKIDSELEKIEYRNISAFDQIKNRMLTGRVDIIAIGDSNQLFGGYGWDNGFQFALSKRFNMYATGLISGYENGSTGAGAGYGYAFNGAQSAATFTDTGAPAGFDDYLDKGLGGLYPAFYAYLDTGTVSSGSNTGMTIDGVSGIDPLDVTSELIADIHSATFAAGSGSFEGAVRINASPFTELATSGLTNTNTGTDGITITSITVPADPSRTDGLALRVTANGVDITAPFAYLWMRWSNPARTTGFSYHTLDARGGESLRTMAYDLQQLSDTALGYYLEEARRLQGKSKMVVIAFNSGLNDRNETLESVGPNPSLPGDSAEAYVDNATALINRFTEVWELNGWNTNELYFLGFPSHPISDPLDTQLQSYRAALETYLQTVPNSQYVNLADLTDETEMLAEGWYQSGGADRNHLTIDGYQQLGERIITDLK